MNRLERQRGGVLSGLLITLLVIVGLVVAGLAIGGWYLARNIRVQETVTARGKTVRVETPLGSLRVQEGGSLDPAKVGIPLYPGAQVAERDHKSVNLELDFGSVGKQVTVTTAEYSVADPPEKVAEFYRRQLPDWSFSESWRGGFKIEFSGRGYKRVVAIRERGGHTRIVFALVGEPPAI